MPRRRAVRHRAVRAPRPTPRSGVRSSPGPIAVLPDGDPVVAAAVRRAGGTVAPLGAETRGIVWTASSGADELAGARSTRTPTSPGCSCRGPASTRSPALLAALPRRRPRVDEREGRVRAARRRARAHARPRRAARGARDGCVPSAGRSTSAAAACTAPTWSSSGAGGIAERAPAAAAAVRRARHRRAATRRRRSTGAARTVTGTPTCTTRSSGAEVVFVAAALTDATRGLIGARELERMPHGAVLVNVARGGARRHRRPRRRARVGPTRRRRARRDRPRAAARRGIRSGRRRTCIVTPHVADTEDDGRAALRRAGRSQRRRRSSLGRRLRGPDRPGGGVLTGAGRSPRRPRIGSPGLPLLECLC